MEKLGDLSQLNTAIADNLVNALNALGTKVTTLYSQVGAMQEQSSGTLITKLPGVYFIANGTNVTFPPLDISINEIGSSLQLNLSYTYSSSDTNLRGSFYTASRTSYEYYLPEQEITIRSTNDIHLPSTESLFTNGRFTFVRNSATYDWYMLSINSINLSIRYVEPNYIVKLYATPIQIDKCSSGDAMEFYLTYRGYQYSNLLFVNSETFKGSTS